MPFKTPKTEAFEGFTTKNQQQQKQTTLINTINISYPTKIALTTMLVSLKFSNFYTPLQHGVKSSWQQ